MKFSYTLYLLLLTGLIVVGCKKPATTIPVGMSCNEGNTAWTATLSTAFVMMYGPGALAPVPVLQLTGSDGDPKTGSTITIMIFNYAGQTGAYTLSDTSRNTATYVDPSTGASYNAASGTVTLTRITSANVQGTFNFKTDSFSGNFTVNNGQFNINLQ
jgi:uncharacterized protein DUF6252